MTESEELEDADFRRYTQIIKVSGSKDRRQESE